MEKSFYLERLPGLKEKFSVKIISGVRGAGKTTLLKNLVETSLIDEKTCCKIWKNFCAW